MSLLTSIYIPVWLYFNLTQSKITTKPTGIYIPVWLYFNQVKRVRNRHSLTFTFQYGYISTGVFKYVNADGTIIYIPVWLYFNTVPQSLLTPNRYIYIPVWLYFNHDKCKLNIIISNLLLFVGKEALADQDFLKVHPYVSVYLLWDLILLKLFHPLVSLLCQKSNYIIFIYPKKLIL